jgi:hypothetical protein
MHQITTTLMPLGKPLCLADFNHSPTVASWLQPRNTTLQAPPLSESWAGRSRARHRQAARHGGDQAGVGDLTTLSTSPASRGDVSMPNHEEL